VRPIAKPTEKVNRFRPAARHREVAGMYDNIGSRQFAKPPMYAVRIRQM
jgi:hypothetical protein